MFIYRFTVINIDYSQIGFLSRLVRIYYVGSIKSQYDS